MTAGESPLTPSGNKRLNQSSQDSKVRVRTEKGAWGCFLEDSCPSEGASPVSLLSLRATARHGPTHWDALANIGLPKSCCNPVVLPLKKHLAPALLAALPTLAVWLPKGYLGEQKWLREGALLSAIPWKTGGWHYGAMEKSQRVCSVLE